MARRHQLTPGDWPSVAARLEELVAAGCGESPLDVAIELVVARLLAERDGAHLDPAGARARVDRAARLWPALLPDPCLGRVPDAVVRACLDATAELRVVDARGSALDAIFEGLVTRRRRGDKGQFLTPRHVCTALVRMVDPQPGERVVDPACGTGGFLVEAARHGATGPLVGVDLDPAAIRLARLFAALDDLPLELHHADGLAPGAVEAAAGGPIDVVLTNPPFAGDVRDPVLLDTFETARLTRPERDVLFLERALNLLRPGGRLGAVVPAGRLASQRAAPLRDWLVRRLHITAVVSLPDATFQPHTALRTALVVGHRRAHPLPADALLPDEPIRFSLSERAGRDRRGRPELRPGADPQGHAWDVLDHDLDAVVRGSGERSHG